ncbi:MAG: choice-of-anchor E domain-containing protein [Gammaproteobacteria bacterium]|nr:choice-of-anchor E domain-containing protein [Gammaproteobacteria bacterium]
MNIKKMMAGWGIITLTSLTMSAQASVITYSTTFNIADHDPLDPLIDTIETRDEDGNLILDADGNPYLRKVKDSVTVSLDRFDDSLGTLNAVEIWFESTWNLTSSVTSFDTRDPNNWIPRASAAGRSISHQSARLIDPFRDIQNNKEVIKTSCNDLESCVATDTGSGDFNDSFDLSGFTLTDFIGTDSLDFRFIRTLTSDLTRCGPRDWCGHTNSNNAWGGTVYVSYHLPEPSTLLLLGLGFLGLGATKLRTRFL